MKVFLRNLYNCLQFVDHSILEKKVLFLLVSLSFLLMSMRSSGHECITKDGYCKGKRLAGRFRVVTNNEDFCVRVVTNNEDMVVYIDDFATNKSKIGHWREVTNNEDFTIRFVTNNEDFTIRYDAFNVGVQRPCR